MHSDCGTNFKGAVSELHDLVEALDRNKLKSFANSRGIKWNFNPPSAPHMGGVWERLVQSVKEVMTRAAYFCSLLLQLTRAAYSCSFSSERESPD